MPPKKRLTSLNYLLIVESSSKCSKIESYLGDRYKCIACNGHIRSIEGLQSIDVKKNYEVTYIIDPEKKAHVDKMRATIAEYPKENIIIASDHDREGEAIAWHICDVFQLPVETTRRIVFHEITKPAILAAVANPGKIDMDMVRAQQARQVLDMIVGFRISPVLWKHLGSSNSLSAGRCQTPALRLVYENELEAKKTMESSTFKHRVQASFQGYLENIVFELDKTFSSYTDVEAFLEASKTHKHTLTIGTARISTRTPPKPFNTATLLQSASNLFGMGAKDIMACCQSLYQLGHITYMRTESRKYSPVFVEIAVKYIEDNWSKEHVSKDLQINNEQTEAASKTPSGSDGREAASGSDGSENALAHEAIRVTNIHMRDFATIPNSNNMVSLNLQRSDGRSAALERVYKMIWQNTVQSCMSSATFNCLPLSVSSANADASYKHTIETVKFPGFLDAKGKDKDVGANKNTASIVLQHSATKGAPISYKYIETIVGFTAHHSRYTEASLIDKLDELGIGRPSTFSMLADVIQTRKYVTRTDVPGVKHMCYEYRLSHGSNVVEQKSVEKMMGAEYKKLVIDPIGITVIEFLLKHFAEFFSYDYTNAMEKRLDAIASGKEPWHQVCDDCDREIGKLIKSLNSIEKRTYKIDDNYLLFFYKNGMLLKNVSEPIFKGIRRGVKVDMAKLERGEYTFADLAEIDDIVLGLYEEYPVTLKPGKYGYYLEWGDPVKKINIDKTLKTLEKTPTTVTMDDLEHLLKPQEDTQTESNIRVLTPDLSVRKSKFGSYIFYKTEKMKKPKFYDLQKFDGDCWTVDREELINWVKTRHGIKC